MSGAVAAAPWTSVQRLPSQRSISGTPGALPAPNGTAWPTAKQRRTVGQATELSRPLTPRYPAGAGGLGAVPVVQRWPFQRSTSGLIGWLTRGYSSPTAMQEESERHATEATALPRGLGTSLLTDHRVPFQRSTCALFCQPPRARHQCEDVQLTVLSVV